MVVQNGSIFGSPAGLDIQYAMGPMSNGMGMKAVLDSVSGCQ